MELVIIGYTDIVVLLQEESYENGAINWSNKVKNHLNK